jgi:GH35 family endo-1,4-beta-xylanase
MEDCITDYYDGATVYDTEEIIDIMFNTAKNAYKDKKIEILTYDLENDTFDVADMVEDLLSSGMREKIVDFAVNVYDDYMYVTIIEEQRGQ